MVLRIKKPKDLNLIFCILLALWLCLAQVTANSLLILGCLGSFLVLTAWSAWKGRSTPLLLFFLPFAPLLKIAPGSVSFYTLALVAVCIVTFVRRKFTINIGCLVPALALAFLTLIARALEKSGFSMGYILFLFLLVLFPGVLAELRKDVDFRKLTVFFALGIIIAALSAQQLAGYRTIARYITVDAWQKISRLSGYYGDPNFYSAQISAVLSGVLLLYLREERGTRRNYLLLLGVVLMYCGFLSGSKAFLLTVVAVGLLWLVRFLTMKGRISRKVLMLAALMLAFAGAAASGLFREQWETFVTRFRNTQNLSDLTTGRTDLWISYGNALLESTRLLLLGRGYSTELVNGRASHNTLIQMVYQLGIPGCVLMISWMYFYLRGTLRHYRVKFRTQEMLILLIGIFLPWMALDMMFFDELFLMPMYALAGFVFCGGTSARNAEIKETNQPG